MRYSWVSSVMSTEGAQSATVIGSRLRSLIEGHPAKIRLNRWPISSSSLKGSDRLHRVKPAIDTLLYLKLVRHASRSVVMHFAWQPNLICSLLGIVGSDAARW